MLIVDHKGLELIRKYGLDDFPEVEFTFHRLDGGIIATRPCELGGVELHVAFDKKFRASARKQIEDFCDSFDCELWGFIPDKRKHTLNMATKIGFKYITSKKCLMHSGDIELIHFIRR